MNKQSTLYTIVFIFIVSFAFVFLLSMTNQVTIERVELNQILARQRAVLASMGVDATEPDQIQREFDRVIADEDAGLFVRETDGEVIYAMEFVGAGLWGPISGFIAVSEGFDTMVGIEFVDDNETPGLGGRINEPWFKEQFQGLNISGGRITVTVMEPADPSEGRVDGVTGATRTSDAIEAIVNAKLSILRSDETREQFRSLLERGGDA